MPRIYKFRMWDKDKKVVCYDVKIDATYEGSGSLGMVNNYIKALQEHYVLMQYTGLSAQNGEVYDGDIIERKGESMTHSGTTTILIEWSDKHAGWINGLDKLPFRISDVTRGTIIGNLYENPNLIEL